MLDQNKIRSKFPLEYEATQMNKELKLQGWSMLSSLVSSSFVETLKLEVDALCCDNDVEINYSGSEIRVWGAHNKSKAINLFKEFSDKLLTDIENKKCSSFDILAIRNRKIDAANEKLTEGRWHLDSFRRQLKVFLFLTDVDALSGAFEMIPKTNSLEFKAKEFVSGNIISPQDILTGSRSYSRLKEEHIASVLNSGYHSKLFTVKAGTIAVVDTSCVHRASPCVSGERYALTAYF